MNLWSFVTVFFTWISGYYWRFLLGIPIFNCDFWSSPLAWTFMCYWPTQNSRIILKFFDIFGVIIYGCLLEYDDRWRFRPLSRVSLPEHPFSLGRYLLNSYTPSKHRPSILEFQRQKLLAWARSPAKDFPHSAKIVRF